MKIKLNSDDNLPLNNLLKLHNLTIIFKKTTSIIRKSFQMNVCMSYKKIRYERIDVSEGIDINKTSALKKCMICHYWYFLDIGYEYEQYVCNGWHNLSIMVYDLDDFMILNIKSVYYRCFVHNMSKHKVIKLSNNSQLDNKSTL